MIEVSSRIPSVDEIVSILAHGDTPTLLVEGSDDMQVFGYFEEAFGGEMRVMQCGGIDSLLQVFHRRIEFDGKRVAFLADRDLRYYDGVPSELSSGIVFTKGYSLENDIICGSGIFKFYNNSDSAHYARVRRELCRWWAFELAERDAGRQAILNYKVQAIITNIDTVPCLATDKLGGRTYIEPSTKDVDAIEQDFELGFRGHQLADLHRYLLARKGKQFKALSGCFLLTLIHQSPSEYVIRIIQQVAHDLKLSIKLANLGQAS